MRLLLIRYRHHLNFVNRNLQTRYFNSLINPFKNRISQFKMGQKISSFKVGSRKNSLSTTESDKVEPAVATIAEVPSTSVPEEAPKEVAKEAPKEVAKEAPKEVAKEAPKEVAKETTKPTKVELPKDVVISLRQPLFVILAINELVAKNGKSKITTNFEPDNEKKLVLDADQTLKVIEPLVQSINVTDVNEIVELSSKLPSASFQEISDSLVNIIPNLLKKGQFANGDKSSADKATSGAVVDALLWGSLRSNPLFANQVKNLPVSANTIKKLFNGNEESAKIVSEFYVDYSNSDFAKSVLDLIQKAKTSSKPAKDQGNFNIDLQGAEMGKVVTRFPPEPSGYLHIGHAKAVLLNDYFAKEYKGKLIVRFDDTNPSKEKMEFEDAIKEDLLLLGVKGDVTTYTSDNFDKIYEYAIFLIKEGLAYVDDTDVDTMRQQRFDGIDSPHRNQSIEEALRLFTEDLIPATEQGQKSVLRAKIDMQNKNKALRDPVIYRCNLNPHHRTGEKWKCYPTYDFACPIIDALEGVTHALRTIEYRDRNPQYEWFLKSLKLRHVHIWDYSRMNFVYTLLSKRKLTWFVGEGLVTGWDDPRFPTIRGIRRRGLTIDALRQYILMQGASQRNIDLEWDKLWAVNKRVIDPVSPRHTALTKENIVKVIVSDSDFKPEVKQLPKHKKNAEVGLKDTVFNKVFFIEHEDALLIKDNEEVTFMDWGNAIVEKIVKSEDGKKVTEITVKLNLNGDFKTTEKKLTWISEAIEGDETSPVDAVLLDYDYLINKPKLLDGDEVKDYLTPTTEFITDAIVDSNLRKAKKGDIIQLERKGYFIIDKAFGEEASVVKTNGDASKHEDKDLKKVYLIHIPDGKMASVQSKADTKKDNEADKKATKKGKKEAKESKSKPESKAGSMYESESIQPELNFDANKIGGNMYASEPIYSKEELGGAKSESKKNNNENTPKKAKKEKANNNNNNKGGRKPAEPEKEQSVVSRLNIVVGKIVDVKPHPDAESLYVEKIDVGEAEPRTIISGLVKFLTTDQMINQNVLIVKNLKPIKMRGIFSYGMVLCASNEDHSVVELLAPPEGSQPGDKVFFKGHEGEPDEQLNPKKKIFETAAEKFITRDDLTAEWDGIPFETEKGIVKARTLKGAHIS